MKPKKVLFLITKSNFGGAQRYVFDLATNVPAEQWECVVALGGDGPLKAKLEAAGIRVIPIPQLERNVSLKKELLASWSIAHLIRNEDPDVLHVNSSKAGAIGTCLGRLLGVPRVIFTAHGWAFNEDRSFIARLVIKAIHWLTVLFSHQTITVSEAVRAQMNWLGTKHKMRTILLGRKAAHFFSPDTVRQQLISHREALAPYQDDPWLFTIGELHPVKGHDVMIAAMAMLRETFPRLRHIIIGDGDLLPKLQKQISESNLTEHVFLTGYIPEAARYVKAADVFVLPSRTEALGYVVIEAAQAGIPVVASNVGGVPEVIPNGCGTLVPPDTSAALVEAIAHYLTHPAIAAAHAAAAQTHVSVFAIDRMCAETMAVYLGK